MRGSESVLIEDVPQRRGYPGGDLGPFGVPPWGGKDRSDPRKRGTPNGGVRNKANLPRAGNVAQARGWAEAPNKANSPHRQKRAPTGEVAGGPSLGPAVQTNPIWRHGQRWARAGEGAGGTVAQADCAKRTQLAPRRPERAAAAKAATPAVTGDKHTNEANSRWSGSRRRGPARSPTPTLPGPNVRNKPNRSGAMRREVCRLRTDTNGK